MCDAQMIWMAAALMQAGCAAICLATGDYAFAVLHTLSSVLMFFAARGAR